MHCVTCHDMKSIIMQSLSVEQNMNFYILDYPLVSITDEYSSLTGQSRPNNCNSSFFDRLDEEILFPSPKGRDKCTSHQNNDLCHGLNDLREGLELTDDIAQGDGDSSVHECHATVPDESLLVKSLRQQITNLTVRLDKQQKCHQIREQKLQALYEEELDIVEEDYQANVHNLIQRLRGDRLDQRESASTSFDSTSKATPVTLSTAATNTISPVVDASAPRTVDKCVNTNSNKLREQPHDFAVPKNGGDTDEDVDGLVSKLYTKLSDVDACLKMCSKELNSLNSNECCMLRTESLLSLVAVQSVGARDKTKPRKRRRRNKFGNALKSPRKDQSTTAVHIPVRSSPSLLTHSISDKPIAVNQTSSKMKITTGDSSTSLNLAGLTAAEQRQLSEIDDSYGWQTVRPRRHRQPKSSHTEAGLIAKAINNVPRDRKQPVRMNAKMKVDPLSYSGKLQLGKPISQSDQISVEDQTINSKISTITSQMRPLYQRPTNSSRRKFQPRYH